MCLLRSVSWLLCVCLAGLVLAAPAAAQSGTWTPENGGYLRTSWELGQIKVDPLGNYFIGMGPSGRAYVDVRTPGLTGTYSGAQAVPDASGAFTVDYGFDKAGASWWIVATGSSVEVVHRGPGQSGSFGTPVTLDSIGGYGVLQYAAIGVSPGGDVVALWAVSDANDTTSSDTIKVAVKPAGSSSFSAPQTLASSTNAAPPFGAAFDAGGSAVLIWGEASNCSSFCTHSEIQEATRPAGPVSSPGFGSASTLDSYDTDIYGDGFYYPYFENGFGGNAVLAYEQNASPTSGDISLYARTRAPGGGFGAASTLSSGTGGSSARQARPDPTISVAADGETAISWTELSPCSSLGHWVMAAFAPAGGLFSTPVQLATGDQTLASPAPESPAVGIAGPNEWVGGWGRVQEAAPCQPSQTPSYDVVMQASGGNPTAPFSLSAAPNGPNDIDSVRAAAQQVSGGYEGLTVWQDSGSSEMRGDFFSQAGPQTKITSGPANNTRISNNQPKFAFSSSESGSTFECSVDGGAFSSCSSPHRIGPLSDGTHTFRVRATDKAATTDPTPAKRSFTVDTHVSGATLSGSRKQVQRGTKIRVRVKVHAGEVLHVVVSGKVLAKVTVIRNGDRRTVTKKFFLKPVRLRLTKGQLKAVVLHPKRASESRAILALIRHHVRVQARVSARFRDRVGNRVVRRLTVRLE